MGIMQKVVDLEELGCQVMREKGLSCQFSKAALDQLAQIQGAASPTAQHVDLRSFLWCSIDNDTSRDLDQLTYAEKEDAIFSLWIAVADVDALVNKNTPLDQAARINTTSVYTPTKIFPMLPEKLSTNLTSLNEGEDRLALVVKIQIDPSGTVLNSSLFLALVRNYAKLTYHSVGPWLAETGVIPEKVKTVAGLEKVLRTQHQITQILKQKRQESGSLTLHSADAEIRLDLNNHLVAEKESQSFANQLIEEFMIAANRATAEYLKKAKIPYLRRVVRTPKYWDRIVDLAQGYGETLPKEPDSKALNAFLKKRLEEDPETFPDLSLTVIKLLGRGEYIVEHSDEKPTGHFALAVPDYTHATAPNRRFPDLIAQRQYKAVIRGERSPYSFEELKDLAAHCTQQEDAATKVERRLNKSAAALLLSPQIGKFFKGIITGANVKGTWVRIFEPAVEGKIVQGYQGLKVGDKVTVQLQSIDIANGFINFITE